MCTMYIYVYNCKFQLCFHFRSQMDSREDIPRVSVDTVQDWQRLRSNCKNAALAHLQAQIGATSLGDEQDTLLSHMNQFIDLSFSTAQPNLRVNGHNYEALNDKGGVDPSSSALMPADTTSRYGAI